jgi:Uma2 family endonuclease
MTGVIAKLKEYAGIGTPHIWLFDPRARQMFLFRSNSLLEIEADLISTDNPHLELAREEVFHE